MMTGLIQCLNANVTRLPMYPGLLTSRQTSSAKTLNSVVVMLLCCTVMNRDTQENAASAIYQELFWYSADVLLTAVICYKWLKVSANFINQCQNMMLSWVALTVTLTFILGPGLCKAFSMYWLAWQSTICLLHLTAHFWRNHGNTRMPPRETCLFASLKAFTPLLKAIPSDLELLIIAAIACYMLASRCL